MDCNRDELFSLGINQKEKGHCEHFELNFTLCVLSHRSMLFIIQADSLKDLIFPKHLKSHQLSDA